MIYFENFTSSGLGVDITSDLHWKHCASWSTFEQLLKQQRQQQQILNNNKKIEIRLYTNYRSSEKQM